MLMATGALVDDDDTVYAIICVTTSMLVSRGQTAISAQGLITSSISARAEKGLALLDRFSFFDIWTGRKQTWVQLH